MPLTESDFLNASALGVTLGDILQRAVTLVGGERGLIVEFGHTLEDDQICARAGSSAAGPLAAEAKAIACARQGAGSDGTFPFILSLTGTAARPIGVLMLDRAPADSNVEALLQSLSMAVAYCLQQAQLYEAERGRRALAETQAQAARSRLDEISAFDNIARAITSMLEPDDILRYIMNQTQNLFNAEAASVALLDESAQALVFQMAVGAGSAGTIGQKVQMGQGIAGWVAQTGRPVHVPDINTDTRWYAGIDKKTGFSTRNLMCVPLTVDDRIIGAMEVINRRVGTFDEDDLRLLAAVSAQVSAALKNARLFHETRRRAEELSTILETGQAIASTLDLQVLLREMAERARRLLMADGCALYLVDATHSQLKPVVAMGPYSEEVLNTPLQITKGVSGWVARHGVGRVMNSAHLDPDAYLVPGTPLEPESLLSVPLQTKGQTIGVMTVSRAGERQFSDDDLRFLTNLATQASVAMVNAQLYEAARDNAARLAALQEIAKAINASLDLGAIMETVIAQIGRLAPHQEFSLALYDAETQRFYEYAPGERRQELSAVEKGWMREALDLGATLVKEGEALAEDGAHVAYMIVPVLAEHSRLGVFMLKDQRREEFSITERAVVAELANHLALAVQNARLYQERERAYRDLAEAQHQLVMSEKLRALGQMASGVAHNFNNVLAIVLGRAQLAMRHLGTDDGLHHDLEAIVRAARDGANIVRRLQEFTRLRPDEKALQLVDPNDIIAGVAEITRPRWKDQMDAEGRSVNLITETQDVPRVAGNPAELREVLTNMIFNALDAMPQGGQITLRVGQEQNLVSISVRDTGEGMSEEIRNRIFEPFFTTKGPQNSGLGLSTSYGIIARHGGEIRVESRPGQGSTFTILLPAGADRVAVEEKRGAEDLARYGRILLIDDEVELCRIIQRALEMQGHTVSAYSAASEALAAFRAEPGAFDLIITDLGMPAISGWDLSAAIRLENASVPIVMITGWGDRLDNHLLQQHRIAGILAKPFDIEDLLRLTGQALQETK